MNQQIIGWVVRSGFNLTPFVGQWECKDINIEHLVELVRQDEREANVKLLEDFAKTNMVPVKDTWRMGLIAGANAIRSKHD